jgi:hypothetical protein
MTSSIATILFTDVVDSTVLMQRLGDERAQRVFERHDPGGALVTGPCLRRAEPRRRSLLRVHAPAHLDRRSVRLRDPAGVRNAGAQRDGRLDDWGAACHDEQVLRLISTLCFFVDDETAKRTRPRSSAGWGRARLVVSDTRNVNRRRLPGVDGVSP